MHTLHKKHHSAINKVQAVYRELHEPKSTGVANWTEQDWTGTGTRTGTGTDFTKKEGKKVGYRPNFFVIQLHVFS